MKNGTQIIYVPSHIDIKRIHHPDTEYGFVYDNQRTNPGYIFCRYWSQHVPRELRTKANGESTPIDRLIIAPTVNQEIVWEEIKKIEHDTQKNK